MAEKREERRPLIGFGGGHREYEINGVNYVVSDKFAEATLTDDKTLADTVEGIIGDEFTDLSYDDEEDIMESNPVRSTAGRER